MVKTCSCEPLHFFNLFIYTYRFSQWYFELLAFAFVCVFTVHAERADARDVQLVKGEVCLGRIRTSINQETLKNFSRPKQNR